VVKTTLPEQAAVWSWRSFPGVCVIVCRSPPIFDRGRHLRARSRSDPHNFSVGERYRFYANGQASECGTREIGRPIDDWKPSDYEP